MKIGKKNEKGIDFSNKNQISRKEKAAFGFGVFSQNLVYAFVTSYIMIFYTDYIGIAPAAIGTLFLISRLWDAINDPIMGIIADKTRTKFGKFRPYLFIVSVPMLLSMIFLFSESPFGSKIIWAYIMYILWSMIYTVSDIPMWSLCSVMSTNSQERNTLISLGKGIAPVAFAIVAVLAIPIMELLGGGKKAFQYTSIIFGVIMMIGMLILFFVSRERVERKEEKIKVLDVLKGLTTNKPLAYILASQLFILIVDTLAFTMIVYFATYNLGDVGLTPIVSLTAIIPMIISIAITVKLIKKIDKKKLTIISLIIRIIGYVILYFVGFNNLILFLIVFGLCGLTFGSTEVLLPSMMVETIDYAELKTGKRTEGIIWSTQTFIVKLASSVSGWLLGIFLTVVNYIPNIQQTDKTLSGMHSIFTLLPGALILFSLIAISFYPLTSDKYKILLEELKIKRQE